MRKLLLALLFVSGFACAEWHFVDENPDGDKFYIDLATIRKDGDVKTAWRKIELKSRDASGEYSSRAKIEINCKKELVSIVSYTVFSDPNLRGKILEQSNDRSRSPSPIAPETINSSYMRIVCQ